MPVISRFFGIIIFMFWRDHAPPHFHAKYGEDEVTIEIESGIIIGEMSKKAMQLIQEWRVIHREELQKEWTLASQRKALFIIRGLE